MSKTPEPKFRIIKKETNIETRRYETLTIAEIHLSGTQSDSLTQGFRILAGYIFGGNKSQQKIAMTAPVVHYQDPEDQAKWITRFFLPENFSIENSPTPKDTRVEIKTLEQQTCVAIKFKGFSSHKNFYKHEQELKSYCEKEQLTIDTNPLWAYYNPPWTLPFLKRNEVIFLVTSQSK